MAWNLVESFNFLYAKTCDKTLHKTELNSCMVSIGRNQPKNEDNPYKRYDVYRLSKNSMDFLKEQSTHFFVLCLYKYILIINSLKNRVQLFKKKLNNNKIHTYK